MECKVITVKKSEFEDRRNPGQKVTGYTLLVALPGQNGCVEIWSKNPYSPDDVVTLEITEGKFHKPKVRIAG